MGNVLAFCTIASPEEAMLRALADHFEAMGHQLHLVLFHTYDAAVERLPGTVHAVFGTESVVRIDAAPGAGPEPLDPSFLDDLLRHERGIYGHDPQPEQLARMAGAFAGFVRRLVEELDPVLILRNQHGKPAFAVVREVLRAMGRPMVNYNRWAYPRTYQFHDTPTWSPDWARRPWAREPGPETLRRTETLCREAGFKYALGSLPADVPKNMILFLGGDGMGNGTTIPGAWEHEHIGLGWGAEADIVAQAERAVAAHGAGRWLGVRQHPHARPRVERHHLRLPASRVLGDHRLDQLIDHADLVLCQQTTVAFHALWRGRPVATFGHMETAAHGLTTTLANADDLGRWLAADHRAPDREAVLHGLAAMVESFVVMLDYPDTLCVLDRYMSPGDPHTP